MDTARREALLANIERWTEWPQTILALALIPILLIPHLFSVSGSTISTLDDLDYLIWGFFIADLLVSVAIAPHRRQYLRRHWLDVALVALPMFRPLRALRSFRLLRVLFVTDRLLVGARSLLVRRGLHYIMLTALVVVVTAGSMVTIFERDSPGATITSIPDGLWWAMSTVTTVGYGDLTPRTAVGRGIGVALMLIGVGLFGVITANFSAYFIESGADDSALQLREINERLERLERLLERASTIAERD